MGGYSPTTCVGNIFSDVTSSTGENCGYIESLANAGILGISAQFAPQLPMDR